MNRILLFLLVLSLCCLTSESIAQKLTADIPYVKDGHKQHVLDIYIPDKPAPKDLPVMFWIHGGGWQVGDTSDVALKPKVLTERGLIFGQLSVVARHNDG